jgi:hypothetical protein
MFKPEGPSLANLDELLNVFFVWDSPSHQYVSVELI